MIAPVTQSCLVAMVKEKYLGYSKIAITTDHSIYKALLVDSLNYNLLSISQLC
jgi:hypothetical protein